MPTPLLTAAYPQRFARVRGLVLGYCDATLGAVKEQIAEELDVDASDLDAVLADQFQAERCTCCGHWFDRHHCNHDDGHGGFECGQCATQN